MIIPDRVKMHELGFDERTSTFNEVFTGYTEDQAKEEAGRCLNCKTRPCFSACPINNDIPDFIAKIKTGEFEEAYKIIAKKSDFPAICGRVCPHEKQCEGFCTMGKKYEPINIGALERFVAERHGFGDTVTVQTAQKTDKKVAIIGSGPAGLACAADLIKEGYRVTVFEKTSVTGGILTYGIPEFRLPKQVVKGYIDDITAAGAEFKTNVKIGRDITADGLLSQGYSAVFLGSGAGIPKFMRIEGENLNGVLSASEFLYKINVDGANTDFAKTFCGKKIIVVGGGNVAMDASRSALRLGGDVTVVYRRSVEELPACRAEVKEAEEEGVKFDLLTNPVKITGDGNSVKAVECVKNVLGEPDSSGRRRPIEVKGSNFIKEADFVIMAIGTGYDGTVLTNMSIDTDKWGGIIVNENGETSKRGVFAGGDVVTGPETVVAAMKAGKTAAKAIAKFLETL